VRKLATLNLINMMGELNTTLEEKMVHTKNAVNVGSVNNK
jgi:hypothetical protein